MKQARIYSPAKNVMQSGHGKSGQWVLECPPEGSRGPEPLMGWTAADGTQHQIKLTFTTKEAAIAYAEKEGWRYSVIPVRERKIRPRNYGDNFKYRPPAEDSH